MGTLLGHHTKLLITQAPSFEEGQRKMKVIHMLMK